MSHRKNESGASGAELNDAELDLVLGGAAPQPSASGRQLTVIVARENDALEAFRQRFPVINPPRIRPELLEIHPDLEDPFPKEPNDPPIPPDLEDPFPPRPPTDFPLFRR